MSMEDLITKFMELLSFVTYIKDEKEKYRNEVLRKERICYEQYNKRFENPMAWRETKQEKLNQIKKGLNASPFSNMSKGHQ
jgi:hypothetical protein